MAGTVPRRVRGPPSRVFLPMTEAASLASDDPQVQRATDAQGLPVARLTGRWVLQALLPRAAELFRRLTALSREPRLQWDLREVQTLDAAGTLLLWRSWGRRRPALLLREEHEAAFAGLASEAPVPPAAPRPDALAPLLALGRQAWSLAEQVLQIVLLAGQLLLDFVFLLRHPARIPVREISANVYRAGLQALPIIGLVGFLVGVVLSYLSARELQAYGANIFIINILGLGIVRELGPLLAAILVAGRSGSSMTAQLGVMRVTEELDALSVMGISHTQRLVLPKVVALAIAMPLIVLWGNALALLGGMMAASWELDISYRQFLHVLPSVVPVANLWLGVGKGMLFGVLIALVACHYGLRIRPNTESLAAGTTESVVTAITVVILFDAASAVIFSSVGLY
jgi:phospholipid/cholesterol/gamma-HCH transport system permease protein